jgi:hypothetical protein
MSPTSVVTRDCDPTCHREESVTRKGGEREFFENKLLKYNLRPRDDDTSSDAAH